MLHLLVLSQKATKKHCCIFITLRTIYCFIAMLCQICRAMYLEPLGLIGFYWKQLLTFCLDEGTGLLGIHQIYGIWFHHV